ncbi:MAG TPA: dinitrogenase iron-molybdenum cofactor biosynthesis protein [Proteobacteria bacterium]|nr:dinitrogenase iron-molybdenum cofactor biosynthesis protein [Pseudomonadota bacterium]
MVKIAVPSNFPGGLEAGLSGHFGHCDVYTVATIAETKIHDVEVIPNHGHEPGACLAPVMLLARNGVQGIISGGMGMRPLLGFKQAGIRVFLYREGGQVKDALAALQANRLPEFTDQHTCAGHGHGNTCGNH